MKDKAKVGDVLRSRRFTGKEKHLWVVEDARMGGGGTGHGPHDIYPDGWQVTVRRLKRGKYDPKGDTIRFYQSGCFTAECMITPAEIDLTKKMKKVFV